MWSPRPFRVAVVHGTGTARPILDEILKGNVKYDFIEVMACPGGCIGGGGQPKPGGNGRPDDSLRQKRIEGLYVKDEKQTIRCSADNTNVKTIYQEFLGKPLGPLSHELLHTSYGIGNAYEAAPAEIVQRSIAPMSIPF